MHRLLANGLIIALVGMTPVCGSQVSVHAAPLEELASRQNVFAIPFVVPPADSKASAPREVRLLVRTDPSGPWQLVSRANPKVGRFQFRAPRDGTYWFAIRTIGPDGQPSPLGQPTAGLKVAVDTRPPQLILKGRRTSETGEIEIEWQAEDPHLDLTSLEIQAQAGPRGDWTNAILTPARSWQREHLAGGQVAMATESRTDAITVRAAISDRAGNRSVFQAVIPATLPAASVVGPPPTTRPPRVPHPHVAYRTEKPPVRPMPAPRAVRPDGSTPWPADRRTDQPLATTPTKPADTRANAAANTPIDTPVNASPAPVYPPVTQEVHAPIQPATAAEPATQTGPIAPTAGLGSRAQPIVANGTSFKLDYPADTPPIGELIKVDLWTTRDAGRTWTSFGTDVDRLSPFQVTVPGKGLYGFRFEIRAKNMTLGKRPQEGDTPDIWVAVP